MLTWCRLKVAVLAVSVATAALLFGSCLGGNLLDVNRILGLVAVGSIFD